MALGILQNPSTVMGLREAGSGIETETFFLPLPREVTVQISCYEEENQYLGEARCFWSCTETSIQAAPTYSACARSLIRPLWQVSANRPWSVIRSQTELSWTAGYELYLSLAVASDPHPLDNVAITL